MGRGCLLSWTKATARVMVLRIQEDRIVTDRSGCAFVPAFSSNTAVLGAALMCAGIYCPMAGSSGDAIQVRFDGDGDDEGEWEGRR